MEKFIALGLSERTIEAIKSKGFEEPTEIQALAIPAMLDGKQDIIAQAQTGTGKTATFALPLIEQIDPNDSAVQAIILAPTRELVIQICEEISSLRGQNRVSLTSIYGGQSMEMQLKALKRGVSIVVGTPGRVMDHLRRGSLKLDSVRSFVLDEADEMLNMGFIDDIEEILDHTPEGRRVLLFSATMPRRIKDLAGKYLKNALHIKAERKLSLSLTDQIYFEVYPQDKFEALCRIVDIEQEFYAIVFCRTKNETDEISSHLSNRGYSASAIHGDLSQSHREKILNQFRKKHITILVATDVAARGIDVNDLTHVINYSLPQNSETYVHRIGRTGRAGREGTAITFVTPSEFGKLGFIKRETKSEIRKESIPTVETIISEHKKTISEELIKLSQTGEIDRFREWADVLLDNFEATDLVAALMTHAYGDKLNFENYKDIRPVLPRKGRDDRRNDGRRSDRRSDEGGRPPRRLMDGGRTRLFIAKGKKDGFNKRTLVEFINKKAGTSPARLQECSVHETYSFVTVPFTEAEFIIKAFRQKEGGRPIVERAKA